MGVFRMGDRPSGVLRLPSQPDGVVLPDRGPAAGQGHPAVGTVAGDELRDRVHVGEADAPERPQLPAQPEPRHAGAELGVQGQEAGTVQRAPPGHSRVRGRRLPFQERVVGPQHPAQPREPALHRAVAPAAELGQDRAPEPVAQVTRFPVGGVFAMVQAPALQERENLLPGHVQKRTDQQRRAGALRGSRQGPRRGHALQPFRPAAPEQPHEHGLHLVVAVVPHRDLAHAPLRGHLREEPVTPLARAGFEVPRAAAVSVLPEVEPGHVEGQRQPGGHAPDELAVVPALPPPDAVVHVGHLQAQSEGGADLPQELQERHRVRAAGHAHQHRVARRQQAVPDEGLLQPLGKAHGGGDHGGGLMEGRFVRTG